MRSGSAVAWWLGPLLAAVGAVACAGRMPQVVVGATAMDLDRLLAEHPLGPGEGLRADEIARAAGASYHLVQVRRAERPHRHVAHDLAVVVLEGRGTLVVDEVASALRAGDTALVPRGAVHWFTNTAASPSVALAVFTPPLDAPDSELVEHVDSGQSAR